MKKEALIVDLDNTIVDTAVRKHVLLKEFAPTLQVDPIQVRKDFHLKQFLGESSKLNESFFERLDSDEIIKEYDAPLFDGVYDVLKKYTERGISIIVLTARPETLRLATIGELEKLGVSKFISEIYMHNKDKHKPIDYKINTVQQLAQQYEIIALIGDRPDDNIAAAKNSLPTLMLRSTISGVEILSPNKIDLKGGFFCNNWSDVDSFIEILLAGRAKLKDLRSTFTDQYSKWLSDLDNKCRITCTISGIIIALAANLLLKETDLASLESLLLTIVVLASVLSLLYSISSFTSRHTSGPKTSNRISAHLKQWIALLIGRPKRWQYRENDALHAYIELKKKTSNQQSQAHYDFFLTQFNTYDPEALSNLRLFQLRAVNYTKAYAERIASNLLIISIAVFLLWLILAVTCTKEKIVSIWTTMLDLFM